MPEQSVYRHFRWLAVIAFWSGQFSAANITADSARRLRFKLVSASTFIFILLQFVNIHYLINKYAPVMFVKPMIFPYVSGVTIVSICLKSYIFLCCKHTIECFKLVDRFKSSVFISDPNLDRLKKALVTCSRWTIALYVIVHLRYFTLISYVPQSISLAERIVQLYYTCFPLRAIMLLVCLFYSANAAAFESIETWRGNVHPPNAYLNTLFPLVQELDTLLRSFSGLLSGHLLSLIFHHLLLYLATIVGLHNIHSPESHIIHVFFIVIFLTGLLVFAIDSLAQQTETLTEEVFSLPVRDLNRADALRVRSVMCHLSSRSTRQTAGGLIDINPAMFLSLLAMGIDYFIMFQTNKDYLRSLSGMNPTPNSNATTATPK